VTFLHRLFGHVPKVAPTGEAFLVAVLLAALCALVVARIVRRLLCAALAPDHPESVRHHTRRSVRIITVVVFVGLTALFVPPLLELFGEPLVAGLRLREATNWFFDTGLRILLIATLAYALQRGITLLLARFERELVSTPSADSVEHFKRARTLTSLISRVATSFIVAAALLMILDKLRVNIAPVLAGAGILGLAIGFGAQTLVKDVISGFFLILENQIRVGDVAELNGIGGVVESLRLRTVVLRDVQGAAHVIPCGSITKLTNLTKDYAYAVVDAAVSHRNDPDVVLAGAKRAGHALATDPEWADSLHGDIEVLGIESLEETGFRLRMRIRTVPHRQWDVARELRRRVKREFDRLRVDMTAPTAGTSLTRPSTTNTTGTETTTE
jgi:small conductance mechanosensitive channel